MVGAKQLFLALAIVTMTAIAGLPARGQCRLCDQPTTAPREDGPAGGDVELRVESSLNFDRLVMAGIVLHLGRQGGAGGGEAEREEQGSAVQRGKTAGHRGHGRGIL